MERKINGYINKLGDLIKLKIFKEDIEDFDHTHEISDINELSESIDNLSSRVTELEQHGGDSKADKVDPELEGHMAVYDEHGNLGDGGTPSQFAPADHTHSAYAPATGSTEYAQAVHTHDEIVKSVEGGSARVKVIHKDGGGARIKFLVEKTGEEDKSASIDYDNIENLERALTNPDSTPIASSDNLVTSGGVKAYVDNKRNIRQEDSETGDLAQILTSAQDGDVYVIINIREGEEESKQAKVTYNNIDNLARALEDPDTEPRNNNDKLITSKAVYDALQAAEGLTVDSALSSSSTNPVQNKEVWAAINEVNEKIDIINLGSIYIERDMNDGRFPIASENTVKDGLESFINNHPENVTFIEKIYVNDLYNDLYFYPTAFISWARRQMMPTKIDVVVFIGGTKKLTATATVPADSLDTIMWDPAWLLKDYSSTFSIVSNS